MDLKWKLVKSGDIERYFCFLYLWLWYWDKLFTHGAAHKPQQSDASAQTRIDLSYFLLHTYIQIILAIGDPALKLKFLHKSQPT